MKTTTQEKKKLRRKDQKKKDEDEILSLTIKGIAYFIPFFITATYAIHQS